MVRELTAHTRQEETSELKCYLHRITDDDAEEQTAVLDLVDSVAAAVEGRPAGSGSFVAVVESAELELERLMSPVSHA